MSSFVIDKNEYIKVAGFFAGLAEIKNHFGDGLVHIYGGRNGGFYDDNDFIFDFVELYNLNCLSVNLQYGGRYEIDYDESIDWGAFNTCKDKIIRHWEYAKTESATVMKHICLEVNQFIDSILYQIEDKESTEEAKRILFKYAKSIVRILNKLECYEPHSWGHFDLPNIPEKQKISF